MRQGIWIDTFDPVQRAHVETARSAIRAHGLDRLFVAPAAGGGCLASEGDRCAMLRAAFAADETIEILRADAPNLDIRAPGALDNSDLHAMLLRGADAREYVPEAALHVIAARGLYLASMPESAIRDDLRAVQGARRFAHTLGVMETAASLAEANGLPAGKARVAGLLHDCAKHLTDAQLLAYADVSGADAFERAIPQLLHAPVGAHIAQSRYSVRDPEILSAIRRHTVGGRGMGILDAIVYVADYIEPNRAGFRGLEDARLCAQADLWAATALCARLSEEYETRCGRRLHPATAQMIQEIENGGMDIG
jgi:predicted HD superfamily hydrolase involved in NAD metabolism